MNHKKYLHLKLHLIFYDLCDLCMYTDTCFKVSVRLHSFSVLTFPSEPPVEEGIATSRKASHGQGQDRGEADDGARELSLGRQAQVRRRTLSRAPSARWRESKGSSLMLVLYFCVVCLRTTYLAHSSNPSAVPSCPHDLSAMLYWLRR
jgi:hypothetical protein